MARPHEKFHIIFSFGQSNGEPVGQGPQDDALAQTIIDRQIWQLGRYGAANMKPIPIGGTHPDDDGLHNYRRVRGHAAVTSFARRYVDEDNLPAGYRVLIIEAAFAGLSVLNWLGEIPQSDRCPDPYGDMIARLRFAAALPGSKIVAGLLALGEKDTQFSVSGEHNMTPALFKSKLTTLLSNLRRDVPQVPPYPIIAHQMLPNWTGGNLATKNAIDTAIREVMAADVLGGHASAANLTSNAETRQNRSEVHYDAASMTRLARRKYVNWKEMQS